MSEHLDIKNVIEVDRIRTILREHPDLLSLFEILIIIANNRINDERVGPDLPIEKNTEPELSDHESDED